MLRVSVLELPSRYDGADEAMHEVDALLANGPPTDLAIVPELAFTGYVSPEGDFDLTRFAEPIDGPTVRRAIDLATKHTMHLVTPLVLLDGKKMYNASIVVSRDGVVATYRKRHPWLPERWATPGLLPLPLFNLRGVSITMAICYDAHFLETDSVDVLEQADLLVFTSAWVDREDSRMPLLRSLAKRFNVAIANANWGCGGVVEVYGQGESCILNARGEAIATVTSAPGRGDSQIASKSDLRRLSRA